MYELRQASGPVTLDLCNNETSFDSQIRVYKKNTRRTVIASPAMTTSAASRARSLSLPM